MPSQAERIHSTRSRLLEAGVALLVEVGLDGFTTTAVATRAGVAQGTVFRHFATKQELLVATVEQALRSCRTEHEAEFSRRIAAEHPDTTGALVRIALECLWGSCTDERALAVIEVRARCRSDAGLRAALEPAIRAENAVGGDRVALLLPPAFQLRRNDYVDMSRIVLNAMQGRALAGLARPDPGRDRAVLESLISFVEQRCEAAFADPTPERHRRLAPSRRNHHDD
ncbi:TetR/AcrR family transcriptional regulator [Aquihabitans sp. McL0605]|uniref:TetR/AcrR family transcriptional regulator n=1 Tax=Aquihabitans sp. McL0605 TaxID=3415671 RepID=UPI003CF014E5